ncbi:hypothetical protein J3R83DRAFT_3753 [Lanmaoa asiatica]|nr:hypothetical protein J3R83DRAFT_3753 [Lanmaoa asiatica]
MSVLPAVLIFTNSEYGQANVNLATAYELALAGVNVYIASFAPLRTRVSRLQELLARHASRSSTKPTGSIVFREFKGTPSYFEALEKQNINSLGHPHGVSGALKSYSILDSVLFPWSQEEYLPTIESCKEIIATTKPNVVVIDYLFICAQDVCELAGHKFIIMLPNTIKDIALTMQLQPNLAALWKYPACSSGFPFPLRWWQILLNIYLNIRLAVYMNTVVYNKQVHALRRSLGIKSAFGDRPGVMHICPALAETDFPFAVIPEEILLCGPIVMPFDPVEESDPALMKWLDNGPTVMINLGSHVVSDGKLAREMASAFRTLLDYHDQNSDGKIQVLWKAMANGDIQTVLDEVVGNEIKEGRGEGAALVGGRADFDITASKRGLSGLPHIVLPVWYDTYDYASRVEFLNIGIFGNKTCSPSVEAVEFGKALVRVTGNTEEAAKFRTSAKRLKELCRAKGNGRELSCAAILKEAGIRN